VRGFAFHVLTLRRRVQILVAASCTSNAGLLRFGGVVERFDEFGIPEVEFNDVVLKDVGHRSDFEAVRAAICGTLGP
jgi:hypothetical protein